MQIHARSGMSRLQLRVLNACGLRQRLNSLQNPGLWPQISETSLRIQTDVSSCNSDNTEVWDCTPRKN